MIATLSARRRAVVVPCTVAIAQTPEDFHAHVDLDGIEVEAGDAVVVHDAPTEVTFGQQFICRRRATVTRAGGLHRLWIRLTARFELATLYEVGFLPRRRP